MYTDLVNKKILITGATGLIGQALVRFAAEKNMEIIALVRSKKKAHSLLGSFSRVSYIESDITQIPLKDLGVDYIIHAAANTSSSAFVEKPVSIINTSFQGMKRVLEFSRMNHIRGIAYLSSMEIYGIQDSDQKITESHSSSLNTMDSRSSYPESKRICENMCASYWSQYGIPVKVVRLTQTLGPGVQYNDKRVFAEFARCVIEKKDIVLHTHGHTKRSYLYIDDAVKAVFMVLLRGNAGEAYNAANEDTYCSIYEMATLVAEKFADNRIKVLVEPENIEKYGYAPTLHMNLDTSKLQALGWKPKTNLMQMYRYMIQDMCRYNND